MSINIQFHRIDLSTTKATSSYTFTSGVNVIEGSYGTGKSSMLELLKYSLGSPNAEIMPAIENNLKATMLEVTIGSDRLRLKRLFGTNEIRVFDQDGLRETWTATQGTLPRAAIRLLEILEVPLIRLSKAGKSDSEAIGFFDLFRQMYLPQADVNSSVAGHKESFLNRKRIAFFELAYGLAGKEVRELELAGSRLKSQKEKAIADAAAVKKFLTDVGAPSEADLTREAVSAREELAEAELQLRGAQKAGAGSTSDQQGLRNSISHLRVATADAEAECILVRHAIEKGSSLVSQLVLDLQHEQRAESASSTLSGIDFVSCPRCLQSLLNREVSDGHCHLCLQAQPTQEKKVQSAVVKRLKEQILEAEQLLRDDKERLASSELRLAELRVQLYELAGELEQQADPRRLMPSIDQAVNSAASRERARARIREVERFRDLWDQHRQLEESVVDLHRLIETNQRDQKEARQQLLRNRSRISGLSEVFDEEIRELKFAGYRSAEVDSKTYLPVVNGDRFDKLSVSGARKTLANVAYYLANLAYASNEAQVLIPNSVLLDSPRTSLGDTPEDIAAGMRIYQRMYVIASVSPGIQILVADNGVPSLDREVLQAFNFIHLSYDEPLLRDVPHPGGASVDTIGSRTRIQP